MTMGDVLVIDPVALYAAVQRETAFYGYCKMSTLYTKFGRWGTWARDPDVAALVLGLEEDKFIRISDDGTRITPIARIQKVMKHYPPYLTSKQILAGLEPIESDEDE